MNRSQGPRRGKKTLRNAKQTNPALSVALKVLIICAIIDGSAWAYFHFVKNVSVWDGLEQIRKEVQEAINPKKTYEPIPSKITDNNQRKPDQEELVEIKKQEGDKIHRESAEHLRSEAEKEKHAEAENLTVASQIEKEEKKRKNPIYSWINENGQKAYSNVGFPKDKKYSDPQIEWR